MVETGGWLKVSLVETLVPTQLLQASSPVFATEEDKNQNDSKNCVEKDINTDPWPGYRYTGKLRPHYPLVRCCHSLSQWSHSRAYL